jgi:hypothetical protein
LYQFLVLTSCHPVRISNTFNETWDELIPSSKSKVQPNNEMGSTEQKKLGWIQPNPPNSQPNTRNCWPKLNLFTLVNDVQHVCCMCMCQQNWHAWCMLPVVYCASLLKLVAKPSVRSRTLYHASCMLYNNFISTSAWNSNHLYVAMKTDENEWKMP